MEISKALRSDAAAIHALECQYIECPWSLELISGALTDPRYTYFVAREDAVVGYIGAELCLDELNITNVAVDAGYRRRGIANRLLSAVIDHAERNDCTKIYLEVNEHNAAAISLYEGAGFTTVYVRKNYYGSDGALVMVKEIK